MTKWRDDSGATIVEVAFALPIFFLLLLGLIDFGMLGFEQNKTTNAARDGARVGIIDYVDADVDGSANYLSIKSAIEAKLPGRVLTDEQLDVECLTPAGGPVDCADATVDKDRLEVTVRWNREAISPVATLLGFGNKEVSGTATMTIVGRPVTGTVSSGPPCEPGPISIAPGTVERDPATGGLTQDLSVTVSGTGNCLTQSLHIVNTDGSQETEICSSGCVGTTSYSGTTDTIWTAAGVGIAELRTSSGGVARSATFDVTDPLPCEVTAVSAAPNPVARLASNQLSQPVDFVLTGADACTNLSVRLTPPGSATSLTICSGSCAAFTYSGSDPVWSADGQAGIDVTGDTPPFSDPSALSVVVACAPTAQIDFDAGTPAVDPGPATARSNDKQLNPAIRITLTANVGADCSDVTVLVVAPPDNADSRFPLCTPGTLCPPTTVNGQSSNSVWVGGTAFVRVTDNRVSVTTQTPFEVDD